MMHEPPSAPPPPPPPPPPPEDRLDALLREAARCYNPPPPAPKGEIWERIVAVRKSLDEPAGRPGILPHSAGRRWLRPAIPRWIGIAALLAIGVAIGRLSAPGAGGGAGSATRARPAAEFGLPSGGAPSGLSSRDPAAVAARLLTVQHFTRVETLLTELSSGQAAQDFTTQARDLLSTTRLLLVSDRLTDPQTRKLLEDLELVLIQIATLNRTDRRADLDLITDGLAQTQLRTRLRNALRTGSEYRM